MRTNLYSWQTIIVYVWEIGIILKVESGFSRVRSNEPTKGRVKTWFDKDF
jgi:hypothetical protein